MGHAANRHHQCIGPAHMARVQQRPKLSRPGLEEMGHEQIEAVPGYRSSTDVDSNAESPCTISASEYDDNHINQRLQQVQQAKPRNKHS